VVLDVAEVGVRDGADFDGGGAEAGGDAGAAVSAAASAVVVTVGVIVCAVASDFDGIGGRELDGVAFVVA